MISRLTLAVFLAWATTSAVAALAASPSVITMGNGLKVILVEDHAANLVGVDVWVKAGSGNETSADSGVSHFIEHMVFGTTLKREAGEMDLEMESLGAELDARTSRDWAHFSTTVSSRYLPKALDVLADALQNAQFSEEDLNRERSVLVDEIAKKRTDGFKVCKDYLAAELYGGHAYGMPVEGTIDSIRKITRQQIADYYHKYYVPRNIAVVMVGDVDAQRATSLVGQAFQGLASAPEPVIPAQAVNPIAKQVSKSLSAPLTSEYLAIGFAGPVGSETADVCATDVMLSYLGFGYRSWMADELAGKMGLATGVTADFLTQRQAGMISLLAAPTPGNTDKAKGAIFARIAGLRQDGIPADRLALAKRSLLGQYAFEKETYAGQANAIGFYYAVSEPDFSTKYLDCVGSVTNADIMRVAQRYLDPSRAVVLVVGPEKGGQQ